MNKTSLIPRYPGVTFIALFSLCTLTWSQAAETKPNILFIAVDDLRPELGCYGNSFARTPHLDRLATEGMLFERAYCQQSLCGPSRASLLSGCRPDTTRITDLTKTLRSTMPQVLTLPQFFKNHGYQSISLGKIYHHPGKDDPEGWTEPEWKPAAKAYLTPVRIVDRMGPATEAADVADSMYADGQTTDEAIGRLQALKKSNQPFFLAVGYRRPHLPFNAPKRYWDMHDAEHLYQSAFHAWPKNMPSLSAMQWPELKTYADIPKDAQKLPADQARRLIHGYHACVSYVDALIGKLVGELDALGMRENTIIVLWGDNGYKLDDYGAWCKQTNFEIDARIPLFLITPGHKKNVRSNALVELVDVYPTLVELCGFPVPAHCEGTSMVPLLDNPERAWKEAVFTQYEKGKLMSYSIRSGKWRYSEWVDPAKDKIIARELYSHADGPLAGENKADLPSHASIVEKMSRLLAKGSGWRAIKSEAERQPALL